MEEADLLRFFYPVPKNLKLQNPCEGWTWPQAREEDQTHALLRSFSDSQHGFCDEDGR